VGKNGIFLWGAIIWVSGVTAGSSWAGDKPAVVMVPASAALTVIGLILMWWGQG
jgi:hypothetical protein